MPLDAGYLRGFRQSPVVRDCVVADAVAVEPVSTPKSPANREKNREFCKIATSGAAETANNAVVKGLLVRIPYSTEQGIVLADAVNPRD